MSSYTNKPLEITIKGWIPPSHDLILAQFEKNLSRAAMAVLLCLMVYANRLTGKCYPSATTLARVTRLSRCSVFRALAELKQKNFIKVLPGGLRDGRKESNLYYINDPNFHYWVFERPVRENRDLSAQTMEVDEYFEDDHQ